MVDAQLDHSFSIVDVNGASTSSCGRCCGKSPTGMRVGLRSSGQRDRYPDDSPSEDGTVRSAFLRVGNAVLRSISECRTIRSEVQSALDECPLRTITSFIIHTMDWQETPRPSRSEPVAPQFRDGACSTRKRAPLRGQLSNLLARKEFLILTKSSNSALRQRRNYVK